MLLPFPTQKRPGISLIARNRGTMNLDVAIAIKHKKRQTQRAKPGRSSITLPWKFAEEVVAIYVSVFIHQNIGYGKLTQPECRSWQVLVREESELSVEVERRISKCS